MSAVLLLGALDAATAVAAAPGVDFDLTYIERTPRYRRYCVNYSTGAPALCSNEGVADGACPALVGDKRWPDVGETVTYTAHVINKGNTTSNGYCWAAYIDGQLQTTGLSQTGLAPNQEATFVFQAPFPASPQDIKIEVPPGCLGGTADGYPQNNARTISSHGLSFSYWVEQQIYDGFNAQANGLTGTYSFEDWIQAHFAQMNASFQASQYLALAPNGITDRVFIDKIFIGANAAAVTQAQSTDPHRYCIDGRWQSLQNATNDYVQTFLGQIDPGLIHEMGHQLGLIDLYRFLLPQAQPNLGIQVTNASGNVVPAGSLPPIFADTAGVMQGGSTYPLNDVTRFENHSAAGMNSHQRKRRGYYGEYLYDTPQNTFIRVLNDAGQPIANATVDLFQKNATTEIIDNTPELSGTTSATGMMQLANRSVQGFTTATGHTLRANPFGTIDVTGTNGTMLVRIRQGSNEWFRWLTVYDLNLAYWRGNQVVAVVPVGTCASGSDSDGDQVRNVCDNCPASSNPNQYDSDWDGTGNECDPGCG